MSLITRCPACGTMFKVVPDQLRISEGWVRCGHCSEVFDASAHLQQEEPAAPGEAAPTVSHPLPAAQLPPDEVAADSQAFLSSLNTEVDEGLPSGMPDSAQLEEEARTLRETPLDRPFELRRQDDGGIAPSRPARFEPVPDAEPELHDLSFVRKARSRAFWRSPPVRGVLALLFLLLGFLLAAQIAVQDRDHLAATQPALRPWLARLCEPLRCRIAPPRQIDAIVIDSSAFNKLRGEAYRLNFTLKNQAAMEVAMPALELTLTDAQDQPVLRRVLLPAEFANAPVIGASAEWPGSVTLSVAANGSTSRIAGYRLLAFYP